MKLVRLLTCGLTVGVAFLGAGAQGSCMGGMPMGAMPLADTRPLLPPEQLPTPIHLTGIGNGHITIKATPEAQVWFDQGLNLLHDFWDFESAKAFEQAIRVDPQCAMCQWGLAQAEGFRGGPEKFYGNRALEAAVKLKDHASKTDKLYIEALVAEQKADESGPKAADTAIYRKLIKKAPNDLQARIYLANSLGDGYDDKGEPKPQQKEKIAMLEAILKDAPNDSAANHYWIHAIEPSNHPERAIPSAALLASLAPTSGHMVHMPGHIYYRVGDYASAEKWFQASTVADEKYMHDQHVDVDNDWNYVHNMMYSIANLMEQGRLVEANALSDRLAGARGELSATLYVWSARDSMARVSNRLPVALRLGDWDAVVKLIDGATIPEKDKTANLRYLSAELREFAVGMRALEQGDLVEAQAASARMDAGLWRNAEDAKARTADVKKPATPDGKAPPKPPMATVMPDAEGGPIGQTMSIASLELRGGVLAAQGKLPAAKKLYAEAESRSKKLGYHEPPLYIRPVGETEATALLRAKDYAGAKAAYEAALVERPNSGYALYGLARVKEMAGDAPGAKAAYSQFLAQWSAADASVPQVVHAREVLGQAVAATR